MNRSILLRRQQVILCLLSWVVVAFGQPAWSSILGMCAALFGYALFWRVLLCYPNWKERFLLATGWFTAVQIVQLSWFISHPYLYIFSVYFMLSLMLGVQFGLLAIFITPSHILRTRSIIALASLWIIFEWSRLYFLSGFSWNPAGLALSGNIYSLQMASLLGVFGLSFWVILSNLLALRAYWLRGTLISTCVWIAVAAIPYAYGYMQFQIHEAAFTQSDKRPFRAVLVQTAFPVEEELGIKDRSLMVEYVINEWRQILSIIKKQFGKPIDLIVLPEFVVPYGTYSFVYPFEIVQKAFEEVFGKESIKSLPSLKTPLATTFDTSFGRSLNLVNNAFWAQGIANYFKTGVLVGLEDAQENKAGDIELYSAALYFRPSEELADASFLKPVDRYEKRILVPMGEYIPFAFCRTLAAAYGVSGSFTCGKNAKVFMAGNVPFGPSICYEETFGNIVRENKRLGAELLANLTNDAWYPNSRLTQQHFEHARLRTVESGIPLIRACNTGITGAIDSLGRNIDTLPETNAKEEWLSDSLHVTVPLYTYSTLYTRVGDGLIVTFSAIMVLLFLRFRR